MGLHADAESRPVGLEQDEVALARCFVTTDARTDQRHRRAGTLSARCRAGTLLGILESQEAPLHPPVAGEPQGGTRAISHPKTRPHFCKVMVSGFAGTAPATSQL
jgi:hypothetical protein